ncbi:hypothetical protein [Amycolatopsis eburnea]|uniref:Uncharacterized protein n=1 Tax=Amycolatopsis eburnea TaxID=2267691 RepID=A0A3R9DFK1_9PSEU|nr:hypothetical protein [Amycolatopsis eburnea]RSD13272.1 hypothetical protein EIY87_26340 [Amycolatopsis eburnea]
MREVFGVSAVAFRFEIRGVAIGLVAAGALRQAEAEQILADLDETLRRSGRLTVVRQEASATSSGEVVAKRAGIEAWSTFLVLNLAHVGIDARRMRERFGPGVRWRGWDDAGTQYRGGSGGGSGSHALFAERRTFEPGPPEQARLLTLAVDHPGGQITLSIPLLSS